MAKAEREVEQTVQQQAASLLYLNPDEIVRDGEVNVRPGWNAAEDAGLEELARSIEQVGQVQPVKVRQVQANGDGPTYHLVAGGRRVAAIEYLNAQKSAKDEPLKVMAVVQADVDDDQAFRQAMQENMKRKDFSPIDLARNIQVIRSKHAWLGARGTKKVAEYLGVSPAKVSTHESLLNLDEETQGKVDKGELSAQTAFELLNVTAERRNEVVEVARSIQNPSQAGQGDTSGDQDDAVGTNDDQDPHRRLAAKKMPKEGKLKARHVRTAARQTDAALATKPLSKGEIVDFFVKIQGPAYGFKNGDVYLFGRTAELWTEGKCKDATLMKHFGTMVSKANKGTAEKASKEEKTVKKTVKKAKQKK